MSYPSRPKEELLSAEEMRQAYSVEELRHWAQRCATPLVIKNEPPADTAERAANNAREIAGFKAELRRRIANGSMAQSEADELVAISLTRGKQTLPLEYRGGVVVVDQAALAASRGAAIAPVVQAPQRAAPPAESSIQMEALRTLTEAMAEGLGALREARNRATPDDATFEAVVMRAAVLAADNAQQRALRQSGATSLEYDSNGRLASVTKSDGSVWRLTYDQYGRLKTMEPTSARLDG